MIYFYEVDNGSDYPEEYSSYTVFSSKEYTAKEFNDLCISILAVSSADDEPYVLMHKVVDGLCENHGFKEVSNTAYFSIGSEGE
jgi:hypothetical protein